MTKCKIKWFVYQEHWGWDDKTGERVFLGRKLIPRQTYHKPSGGWHGYEARCTTHDWQTHSGGAIPASIRREIDDHKWEVAFRVALEDYGIEWRKFREEVAS